MGNIGKGIKYGNREIKNPKPRFFDKHQKCNEHHRTELKKLISRWWHSSVQRHWHRVFYYLFHKIILLRDN